MKHRAKIAVRFAGTLALTATAALGCSKPAPTVPTDFGVNITVDAKALSAATLTKVAFGLLVVSNAETQIKQFPVVPQISTGQLTFRYIPAAGTTGSLSFEFDALDGSQEILGSGQAGPVKLEPTSAVSATITLAAAAGTAKGLGAKCTADSECGSGFCTDGVCCQEACKDTCASCALTTSTGLCVGYADGTDPENECAGSSMTSGTGGTSGAGGAAGAGGAKADAGAPNDASASDAEMINPPDGGIVAMPNVCGGKCNGMKGCASFAKSGTSCGTPFCNTHKDLASPICDGKGTCAIGLSDCTDGYSCDPAAKPSTCHTNCNSNNDCGANYYCNGTTSMCAPTKVDGLTCATDAECLHNHCVGAGTGASGVCCNVACASPFTCNDSGSAGTCRCPGVATCATGVSCAVFYPDADGDTYGDKTASIATSTAKAACADSTQPGFVLDNTDCDDHDANVHPGQTAYFNAASNGTKTFDYDCDGTLQKGLAEYPGASCTFCPSCQAGCSATGASTCSSAGGQASLACPLEGGICLSTLEAQGATLMSVLPDAVIGPPIIIRLACCGCNDYSGFTASVGCGVAAAYYTCGTCASAGAGASGTTSVSTKQSCH